MISNTTESDYDINLKNYTKMLEETKNIRFASSKLKCKDFI